ncbi:AraC family transcriptional regulator [Clostridium sp. 19966]|uniref:AraC family transcriptional regulator n=1 Tax=Clostridium sp. 19966 TaxID=2768166 RepID=UPI0028DDEEF5|nr:AraC family transcriptional regulator [Clostridium sp. 19966]MDT8716842.1 AraC family transcriptional regulator [Clostridium sp. 19966]
MKGIRYSLSANKGNIEMKECVNAVHCYKTHFHNEFSIGIIEKGTSKSKIHNREYIFAEGDFLIIPPNVPHKCTPIDYNDWNFKMLYLDKEWFQKEFNIKSTNFICRRLDKHIYEKILRFFTQDKYNILDMEKESELITVIASLVEAEVVNSGFYYNKLARVEEHLRENYLSSVTLGELAEACNMSKYYLIKKFEENYGLPPHKYIINLRVNNAKKLLRKRKTFAQVALESGFYDQSHFIKAFKAYTGVTPLEYICNT